MKHTIVTVLEQRADDIAFLTSQVALWMDFFLSRMSKTLCRPVRQGVVESVSVLLAFVFVGAFDLYGGDQGFISVAEGPNLFSLKVLRAQILEKSSAQFQFPVHWGISLQSEHEKYLAGVHCKGSLHFFCLTPPSAFDFSDPPLTVLFSSRTIPRRSSRFT